MIPSFKLHLPQNKVGRDFVCGDIHGCGELLKRALTNVNFDKQKDRLLMTGDVVDRGPDSFQLLCMLDEPWAFSCRGNHERWCYDIIQSGGEYPSEKYEFSWSLHYPWTEYLGARERVKALQAIEKMASLIAVGEGPSRYNIVHAGFLECSAFRGKLDCITDSAIDALYINDLADKQLSYGQAMQVVLQSKLAMNQKVHNYFLSDTYLGHTIVENPFKVGSFVFIDTGAGVSEKGDEDMTHGAALTLAEPESQTFNITYAYSNTFKQVKYNETVPEWMVTV